MNTFELAVVAVLVLSIAFLLLFSKRSRSPSRADLDDAQLADELKQMRKALVDLDKAPLTPPETSLWFNKVLVTLWPSLVHPLLLESLVPALQEHLDRHLPPGTSLRLENMHLGLCPPQFANFKVLSGKGGKSGGPSFEVDLRFLSDQACIELAGSRVDAGLLPSRRPLRIRIDLLRVSGTLRFTPVHAERLVLWSFKEPPKVTVGARALTVAGAGGQRTDAAPSLDLQRAIERALEQEFTLPRRHCSAVEPSRAVAIARPRTLSLTVHGGKGLPMAEGGGARRSFVRVRCGPQTGQTDVAEGCDPSFQEAFSFSLEACTKGEVTLELCEEGGGRVLGRALVDFKDLEDGTVAVWATGDGLLPVAKRLDGPAGASWPVRVPLLGLAPASLVLEAALTDWEATSAAAGQAPPGDASLPAGVPEGAEARGGARSAQPRVLTLHITGLDWARAVPAEAGGTGASSDQYYIRMQYGDEELSTRCHSLAADDAEWDEALVIEESFLVAARRVRFHLMHRKGAGLEGDALVRNHGDTIVASASLALDSVRQGRDARRLVLLGEALGETGRLFVEVEAASPQDARSAVLARSLWDASHSASLVAGVRPTLTVHVKAARNLVATRTAEGGSAPGSISATPQRTPRDAVHQGPSAGGAAPIAPAAPVPSADPFCVVTYGGQLHRSKVIRNSLQPKLDLKTQFEFVPGRLLEIELWDLSAEGDASECLGAVAVHPGELPLDREFEQWVRLDGVASGEVLLYLHRKEGGVGTTHRARSLTGVADSAGDSTEGIPAAALLGGAGGHAGVHRRAESALPALASLFIAPPLEEETRGAVSRRSARLPQQEGGFGGANGTPKTIPENGAMSDDPQSDSELRNLGGAKKNHSLLGRTGQRLASRFQNFRARRSGGDAQAQAQAADRHAARESSAVDRMRQELAVKDRLIRDKEEQMTRREAEHNKAIKRMKRQQGVLLDKLGQLELAIAKMLTPEA